MQTRTLYSLFIHSAVAWNQTNLFTAADFFAIEHRMLSATCIEQKDAHFYFGPNIVKNRKYRKNESKYSEPKIEAISHFKMSCFLHPRERRFQNGEECIEVNSFT